MQHQVQHQVIGGVTQPVNMSAQQEVLVYNQQRNLNHILQDLP
jgi:hypothetical protein